VILYTVNQILGKNRYESLSKMNGVYKMLDTLQTVKKFKQITSFVTVLASGYINVGNFDYGPIFPVLVIMKWRAFA
jgi:hypothetical protein